jgi:NAD+ synthetase
MLVARKEVETINNEILKQLDSLREKRGFHAQACLDQKIKLINSYFTENKLSAAVIGLSGGIDSAVTLGLLVAASKVQGSPIKRVLAAALPFSVDQGATNQELARDRASLVAESFGAEFISADLGAAFRGLKGSVESVVTEKADSWADGQLVAYLRTPAFYYLSAILTSNKQPAIVCGTTNRDEGAYLGFFGKASDGMVDLQVISDLHKSEVYQLARLLKVPESTVLAAPTGDVYDGKTHLEMIGAPYDFVELYMNYLCMKPEEQQQLLNGLSIQARSQFDEWAKNIEEMHKYNAHKYVGGNPSIHLEIYPRAVPGGWVQSGVYSQAIGTRKLVGEFQLDQMQLLNFLVPARLLPKKLDLTGIGGEVSVLDAVLSANESKILLDQVSKQKRLPVGIDGFLKNYDPKKDQLGSYRATTYSPELADILWSRLKPLLPAQRIFDAFAATDWGNHAKWKPVGINPAFRYIWYEKGGELVVHYDAGYDPKDGKTHTLMSLVLYLTDCDPVHGGQTRFIQDLQLSLSYAQRDFSDWDREAKAEEVIAAIEPKIGRALLFDHRLLHDAQPWSGPAPRVIIRTDVIFEKA